MVMFAGVVLFEMWCGKRLFNDKSRAVRLAIMEHVLGPQPVEYLSEYIDNAYYINGSLDTRPDTQKYVLSRFKPLHKYVAFEDGYPDEQFIDLMRCVWQWEHYKRACASELLRHPFFKGMSDVYGGAFGDDSDSD